MDNEDGEWVEVLKRSGLEGKHFEARATYPASSHALTSLMNDPETVASVRFSKMIFEGCF